MFDKKKKKKLLCNILFEYGGSTLNGKDSLVNNWSNFIRISSAFFDAKRSLDS